MRIRKEKALLSPCAGGCKAPLMRPCVWFPLNCCVTIVSAPSSLPQVAVELTGRAAHDRGVPWSSSMKCTISLTLTPEEAEVWMRSSRDSMVLSWLLRRHQSQIVSSVCGMFSISSGRVDSVFVGIGTPSPINFWTLTLKGSPTRMERCGEACGKTGQRSCKHASPLCLVEPRAKKSTNAGRDSSRLVNSALCQLNEPELTLISKRGFKMPSPWPVIARSLPTSVPRQQTLRPCWQQQVLDQASKYFTSTVPRRRKNATTKSAPCARLNLASLSQPCMPYARPFRSLGVIARSLPSFTGGRKPLSKRSGAFRVSTGTRT